MKTDCAYFLYQRAWGPFVAPQEHKSEKGKHFIGMQVKPGQRETKQRKRIFHFHVAQRFGGKYL